MESFNENIYMIMFDSQINNITSVISFTKSNFSEHYHANIKFSVFVKSKRFQNVNSRNPP